MMHPDFTASIKANGHGKIDFINQGGMVEVAVKNKITGEEMVMSLGQIETLNPTFFHALFSIARDSDPKLRMEMQRECVLMERKKSA